jgi:hypothetical protein
MLAMAAPAATGRGDASSDGGQIINIVVAQFWPHYSLLKSLFSQIWKLNT